MIGPAGFMAAPSPDEKFRCTCCGGIYPYAQMATRNGVRENCPACLPGRCMVGTMKRVSENRTSNPAGARADDQEGRG